MMFVNNYGDDSPLTEMACTTDITAWTLSMPGDYSTVHLTD